MSTKALLFGVVVLLYYVQDELEKIRKLLENKDNDD